MAKLAKKEIKDQAILKAAEEEFLLKGLDSAVMETIASSAGVSKATLYKYYPTKEELFSTLVQKLFSKVHTSLDFIYDKNQSINDLFFGVLEKKFALLFDEHFLKLGKIVVLEQLKSSHIDPQIRKQYDEGKIHFTKWVKKCQGDQKIPSYYKASEISLWFDSIVEGLILWPLILGIKSKFSDKEKIQCQKIIYKSFLKTFS